MKLSIRYRLLALGRLLIGLLVLGGVSYAAPPAAPSNLRLDSSTAPNLARIAWDDNATDEIEFVIEFKFGSSPTFQEFGDRPETDSTTFPISGFEGGTPVFFRMRAGNADGLSDYSNELTVVTGANYQIAASCVTVTPGGGFSTVLQTNFEGVVEPQSVLPAWMSWDAESQTLSGTAAPEGIVKVSLSASSGPHSRVRDFFVQVINEGPVVTDPPVAMTLVDQPGGLPPVVVDLMAHFEDPDMGRAAAMNTPFGPINIGFYDDPVDGAPGTVDNFFAYAEAGRWDGTFFHRSVEKFVIQGGGFVPDGITEGSFVGVESFDPIVNEFNAETRSNICGTISMAKVANIPDVPNTPERPNGPDSATSQWFFSVNDNQSILNPQNGGFTVFGRVAGMAVVDQISAFETGDYAATVDGGSTGFSDWPLSAVTENSPLVSELASMSSVVEIPTLGYALTGGAAEIATGAVDGSDLSITAHAPGQVDLVVTATDLDGAEVSATWGITVQTAYAAWAEDKNLSGDGSDPQENRDGGTLLNLQDYAFGGDPLSPQDDPQRSPALVEVEDGGDSYDAIMFYHHKYSSDLTYTVQTSTDMLEWADLWTTADGNDAELVAAIEETGDFWKLTVRSATDQASGGARQFFRTLVGLSADE